MKSLFNFLVKYHVFLLFLLLEVLSVGLIVRYNNFQRIKFLNSSNAVTGYLFEQYQSVNEYFTLKRLNEDLANENASLRNELQTALLAQIGEGPSRKKVPKNQYHYFSAKITNNSINRQHNFITLNKGALDGVKPDMGIVCENGLVGIVIDVSDHYSYAFSLLNKRIKVSAKIKKNGYYGSLQWDGEDPQVAVLNEIPFHVEVQPGDEIITSGYSSIFPEGIRIGEVKSVIRSKTGDFKKINVRLSADFKNLSYVEVIENKKREEQLDLENKSKNE